MSEIEKVTLDGITYKVDDLTTKVKELFNFTIKLQDDLQEKAYELKKTENARKEAMRELKEAIEADKIPEYKEDE
jgi:uncharacterized protein YoxC|tara:strand:+ start:833 stop:1057 length:225 start_codon:yes stop_codon:yes gene_type:complete